jgi:uncharacterized phage protein (TIGR02220 family)
MRTQKDDNFLKWRRGITEHVLEGRLTFEEYGLFSWICTMANPYTGILLTNFSQLSYQLRISREKARYLCNNLKRKRYIWFDIKQGQRNFTKLYIAKFPLPDGTFSVLPNRVSEAPYEVEALIPKLEKPSNADKIRGFANKEVRVSEVSKKEKEKEKTYIVSFLNKELKTNFSPDRKETKEAITALFAEGYTVEDIKKVIRWKKRIGLGQKWRSICDLLLCSVLPNLRTI